MFGIFAKMLKSSWFSFWRSNPDNRTCQSVAAVQLKRSLRLIYIYPQLPLVTEFVSLCKTEAKKTKSKENKHVLLLERGAITLPNHLIDIIMIFSKWYLRRSQDIFIQVRLFSPVVPWVPLLHIIQWPSPIAETLKLATQLEQERGLTVNDH